MRDKKIYNAMVRLDGETYFALRRVALDRRRSFNQLARDVLERYLATQRPTGSHGHEDPDQRGR